MEKAGWDWQQEYAKRKRRKFRKNYFGGWGWELNVPPSMYHLAGAISPRWR